RLRHRARGRRRLPPACRDPSRGRRLDDRRPRLHQRRAAQRPGAGQPARPAARRPHRARLHGDHLRTSMTTLAPVSVALKFGFLAVMYLFALWVARSARKDLRGGGAPSRAHAPGEPLATPDATGFFTASALGPVDLAHRAPRLVVERAP